MAFAPMALTRVGTCGRPSAPSRPKSGFAKRGSHGIAICWCNGGRHSGSSLSKVIGRSRTRLPVALKTAFATAAVTPVMPISPIPRAHERVGHDLKAPGVIKRTRPQRILLRASPVGRHHRITGVDQRRELARRIRVNRDTLFGRRSMR